MNRQCITAHSSCYKTTSPSQACHCRARVETASSTPIPVANSVPYSLQPGPGVEGVVDTGH
eukprot:1565180-Amphidinium_carterae.2